MVAYNFTIDDTSPMIKYTGTWIHKHPEGELLLLLDTLSEKGPRKSAPMADEVVPLGSADSKVGQYFNKNFAKTRTVGDTAELRFNGSAIWAYGSRRESHVSLRLLFLEANIRPDFDVAARDRETSKPLWTGRVSV
jgi:hypothetical protein